MQPPSNWAGIPTSARRTREGDSPTVSVLVLSGGVRSALETALRRMLPKCESIGAQVVVVGTLSADLPELRRDYPEVNFVAMAAGSSMKEMRATGMAEVEGDIVLLQEDWSVGEEWIVPRILDQMLAGASSE